MHDPEGHHEHHMLHRLVEMIERLSHELKHTEHRIMSAISDFSAKMTAHTAKVDTAIAGLATDIQTLNDKIAELQSTPGAITPEDQALLDTIEQKAEAISTKLDALDAITPPVVPTVP